MRIPWPSLAQYGIVRDVKDYKLPPNAWTEGRGVRFQDDSIVRMQGHQQIFEPVPVGFVPYWAMHAFDLAAESHWIIAGLTKVYAFSSGVWTEITKTATTYGATQEHLWNGGFIGNIPILNNGVEKPQMWAPISSAQLLVDLTNWPATHVAQVVRPFDVFLVALDITEGGVRFPHRVRCSHPAAPGAVPSSWNDLDATKSVFVRDMGDYSGGFVVDCLGLGQVNVIYKESSTLGMQFIGGTNKWRTFQMFTQSGILSSNCAAPFANGAQHFVLTGEDLIFHGGQNPTSILSKRGRRWLLKNIDGLHYKKSFVFHDAGAGECVACVPLNGSSWPNLGVVWNYRENTVTYKDLDQLSFAAGGVVPQQDDETWDSDNNTWDSDLSNWNTLTHPAFVRRLIAPKPTGQKLFHLDYTNQANSVNFRAYVERSGIDVLGITKSGDIVRDRESMRLLRRIYIQAVGAPFDVWIGTQQITDGPMTWQNEGTFIPGEHRFVDIGRSTQMWGMRFESATDGAWEISGLEPDIEPLGEH